ncbi:hypothetical protein G6F61_013938 [Rhizopus arrhizus]|nr:hypothetical protein G6F61_013938 [Rhizopus arrhizus]
MPRAPRQGAEEARTGRAAGRGRADPSTAPDGVVVQIRDGRRAVHRRRWLTDGVGAAAYPGQRPPPYADQPVARHDGQREATGAGPAEAAGQQGGDARRHPV